MRITLTALALVAILAACTRPSDERLNGGEPTEPTTEGQANSVCVPGQELCQFCQTDTECAAGTSGYPLCGDDGYCGECHVNAQCEPLGLPICHKTKRVCVACEVDSHCTDNTNLNYCLGGACVECLSHDQCDSGVCDLVNSTCEREQDVLYVAPGAIDGPCTRAEPCDLQSAIGKRQPKIIFVQDGPAVHDYVVGNVVWLDTDFQYRVFVEEGVSFTVGPSGPALSFGASSEVYWNGGRFMARAGQDGIFVGDNAAVELVDIEVIPDVEDGRITENGVRVDSASLILRDSNFVFAKKDCVSSHDAKELTIVNNNFSECQRRGIYIGGSPPGVQTAVIRGNRISRPGVFGISVISDVDLTLDGNYVRDSKHGGISVRVARASIYNNIVAYNGGADVPALRDCGTFCLERQVAGVALSNLQPESFFAFNTVYRNRVAARGGWNAGVWCNGSVDFHSNIVHGNQTGDDVSSVALECGAENTLTDDPQLIGIYDNFGGDPRLDGEFHLRLDSEAVDRGRDDPRVPHDFDGEIRPGSSAYDVGADEIL